MKKVAYKKFWGTLCLLLTVATLAMGKRVVPAPQPALTDSTHFVTASILAISPGPDIYSALGHTALRMQCPSKGLDYCFSFETEVGLMGYLTFFAGQSRAGFVPVPTDTFLVYYRQQGRSVEQYELNLTPHEKQELWRALDNDMLEGAHRKFNLLQNNCTSMAMVKIESVMQNEAIDFGRMPEQMYYNNGKLIRWDTRKSPWTQFLFLTFGGTEADNDWSLEEKMPPELVIPVLRHACIVPTTSQTSGVGEGTLAVPRPVLTGRHATLLPLRTDYSASPVTPLAVAAIILLLTVVFEAFALFAHRPPSSLVGGIVFSLQTILGALMLYITLVSGLFGLHWNWLLIPLNPLPLVVWLVCRCRPCYPKVYLVYAVVLVAFVAVVPWLTSQLQLPHYLFAAALAVWCVGRAVRAGFAPPPKCQTVGRPLSRV